MIFPNWIKTQKYAPSKVQDSITKITAFKGLDLGHTALNVDIQRSPNAKNMLRSEIGQIRKRMGYHKIGEYGNQINGAFIYNDELFIHSGTNLYRFNDETKTSLGTLADTKTNGWTLDGRFYIVDGVKLRQLSYANNTYTLSNVEDSPNVYIPKVIISRNYNGGGVAVESYNLMTGFFTNSFVVTSATQGHTAFQLTQSSLDEGSESAVIVKVMNSSGVFETKTLGTDYSVNTQTGVITFTTAPSISPVNSSDNVVITAKKTISGNADKVNKCTISALYGINGATDRLFVTGNSDFPNRDYWSAKDNPTYFGELNYSTLGQESSAIVGYSIVNSMLATFKDGAEDGQTIYIRQGELTTGTTISVGGESLDTSTNTFRIINTLIGKGSVSPNCHNYIGKEPLFLTREGIYAITNEDVTGEKISQSRSYYIDAKLRQEEDLSEAYACVHNNFYMLFINGRAYCLDYLQKSYEKNQPYSSFQYEGYLLDSIPARVVWDTDGELFFGTETGKIYKFYTDTESITSYSDENDDGTTRAIECYWDTPYISGNLRYTRKKYTYFASTLAPSTQTGARVYGRKDGIWELLFDDFASATYLDFSSINFNYFSFNLNNSPINMRHKTDVGIVDKAQFRLENNVKNEPFGIYDISVEYEESTKF